MKHWSMRSFAILVLLLAFPQICPAPLIYTPGEGWRYESVGGGNWQRSRAKDQLEVAQAAFDQKDYSLAFKAARRTVKQWPFSDYAPQAQYLMARCYEARGQDEREVKAYQKLIERYPKIENYDDIVKHQFDIANRFLAGQYFKVGGYVPLYRSMDKTVEMYEQIIKNGRYNGVAPAAQMNIGAAYENKKVLWIEAPDYPLAAKAYEKAADHYGEQKLGTDALYKLGLAYNKQASKAEYDQSVAAQAISTFGDFATLHPGDPRVLEAQQIADSLKTEQARGSFDIARFYEKNRRWEGAKIYYNEVVLKDPSSKYADAARKRIDAINKRLQSQP